MKEQELTLEQAKEREAQAPPLGWVWPTLRDILIIEYGKGLKKSERDSSGQVPVYGSNGIIGRHDRALVSGPCIIIGRKGTAGAIHYSEMDCWPIDTTYYTQPPNEMSSKYLYYALNSLDLGLLDKSTAVPGLNRDELYSQTIPLAPLPEQNRIVTEIEKQFTRLDAGVDALKWVQVNLQRYKAVLFKAACEGRLVPTEAELARTEGRYYEPASELLRRILAERRAKWEAEQWATEIEKAKQKAAQATRKATGHPLKGGQKLSPEEWQYIPEAEYSKYLPKDDKWKQKYKEPALPNMLGLPDLPEGWRWISLPQIGELARGKSKHRPRNDNRLFGGPYPFIQTGEIRQAEGTITTYSQTYSEFGLAQSRLWPKGTLCITIAANIAATAILGFDACFPDSVVGLIPETGVNVRFIDYFFRTVRQDLDRYAPATAQKNINLKTLQDLAVPLPPLAEQRRIVEDTERRLSTVEALETSVSTYLIQAEQLRRTVLERAFQGKLVQQDPSDEPASVLLERIREERAKREKQEETKRRARRAKGGKVRRRKKRRSLYEVLVAVGKPLTPEQLFDEAGFSFEIVDEFYEELRRELDDRVVQVRPNDTDVHLRIARDEN